MPPLVHLRDFRMDLRHERARRIEDGEPSRGGFRTDGLGNSVRGEDDRAAGRHFVEPLDEHRPLRFQIVDDEAVVDDLVPDVDRCAELRERLLDDCDRAIHTRTEAARIREKHLHRIPLATCAGSSSRRRKLSKIRIAAPTVIALSATLKAGYAHPA
jgi:hypothetical protein